MSEPETRLFSVRAASFAAAGRTILEPTDLMLDAGRMYALIGPNGSGKSTLVKMLARQQGATSGTVELLGRSTTAYSDREFARLVAYMPQFMPPAESMSVRELVGLGRFPWHGPLGRLTEEDNSKVEEAIDQAQLRVFSDRMVDSLSGGERQRAWLAMMLAQDTRCLLLDEPTSALDIAHQVEMLALVRELSRRRNLGVVVVLHDMNMAARYFDHIIALNRGRMVAQGSPSEIATPDVLGSVFGLPLGIIPHPATGVPISYVL